MYSLGLEGLKHTELYLDFITMPLRLIVTIF